MTTALKMDADVKNEYDIHYTSEEDELCGTHCTRCGWHFREGEPIIMQRDGTGWMGLRLFCEDCDPRQK